VLCMRRCNATHGWRILSCTLILDVHQSARPNALLTARLLPSNRRSFALSDILLFFSAKASLAKGVPPHFPELSEQHHRQRRYNQQRKRKYAAC
jgi:hypothetical protein